MVDSHEINILIVDDSQVMRQTLYRMLTNSGFNVVGQAADGLEAVELFEQLKPDLVTLDIVMPKMRGTEVLKEIISKDPKAKIIMATSISDARTVMYCLKMGAKQYIIKPYNQQEVTEAIKKALIV